MAKLKKRHKIFIVEQLACFEPPGEITAQLKKKFEVKVSQSQIAYYHPENRQGSRELARKWRHMFNETRDSFLSESSRIPISHKNYRLQQLQKIYQKLVDQGDLTEACKVLEQAGKEMGGAYNHRQTAEPRANNNGSFYKRVNQKIIEMNKN